MSHIFLVYGSCGHYEDYTRWNVKAFADLSEANKFAADCNKDAVEEYDKLSKESSYWGSVVGKLDSKLQFRGEAPIYEVDEVEFVDNKW